MLKWLQKNSLNKNGSRKIDTCTKRDANERRQQCLIIKKQKSLELYFKLKIIDGLKKPEVIEK